MRQSERLAQARSMADHWRREFRQAQEAAQHWERVAQRLRGELAAVRAESDARLADAQATVRELVGTIGRYPESLADILNPRMEQTHPVGMDSIGLDDALGERAGGFPEIELDPSMNGGRASTLTEAEEAWPDA